MINTSLFPYPTMPFRLEHKDSQKGTVICHFQCREHLDKYLLQHKINSKSCVILNANDESFQSCTSDTPSVQQRTRKTSAGSTDTNRRRTKKLDSTGTVGKDSKPAKKPRKSK